MITAIALTLLTSCAGKVKIDPNAEVVLAYQYEGTSVTSTLTGINASLVINNLNGLEITDEAPKDANYVDGVYFMIGDKEGYVELEHYRFDALMALFEQFGVSIHSH